MSHASEPGTALRAGLGAGFIPAALGIPPAESRGRPFDAEANGIHIPSSSQAMEEGILPPGVQNPSTSNRLPLSAEPVEGTYQCDPCPKPVFNAPCILTRTKGSQNNHLSEDIGAYLLKHLPTGLSGHWPASLNIGQPTPSDVSYSYYPFLTMGNARRIPHQDFNFLETQGCMRVPIRPWLDEIVQQYFLHVHPFLPLVHEGDFWDLYQHDGEEPTGEKVSLLLFQAMLFASCTFVSESTMKALGYPDIRSMRGTLLRRAKLLYDLGSESSPLVIAQASVLLSFASLTSTKTPNTLWLSIAIENAKLAEAHLYPTMTAADLHKQRGILKRLWWCCIIRDRSIGLLMRRPIKITTDHWDFSACPLVPEDFADERSRVYNSATKRRLSEILAQTMELYVILTKVLMLVFPHKDSRTLDNSRLQDCKASLRRWYSAAASRFPKPHHGVSMVAPSPALNQIIDPGPTTLYINFMYLYYHTSRIALCNHEIFHLNMLQEENHRVGSLTKDLSTISDNRQKIQDATSSIIRCHKELIRLGLARWLPIPAVGCIALPLTLNILTAKLSSTENGARPPSAVKQHHLNLLIEVMKGFWRQYDGVDWLSDIIRHTITSTQLDESKLKESSNSDIDWADVLASQPKSYLRLVLALDMGLSKGRLPKDVDFPDNLRHVSAVSPNPQKEADYYGQIQSNEVTRTMSMGQATLSPIVFPYQMDQFILGIDDHLEQIAFEFPDEIEVGGEARTSQTGVLGGQNEATQSIAEYLSADGLPNDGDEVDSLSKSNDDDSRDELSIVVEMDQVADEVLLEALASAP